MKKVVIIIASIIILTLITLITLQTLYKKNRLEIIPKKTEIAVYEEIELKDILDENIEIKNYTIDTNTIGKQELEVEYKNKIFNYKDKIEINITDTINPTILVRDITIQQGNEIDLVNNFLCGDNYDIKPNCYIEGEYNINEIGTYNLKYIAEDSSNNKTEKNFNLNVIEPPKPKETEEPIEPIEESFIDFQDVIKTMKTNKTKIGIDVSKWQGNIDFEEIKKQGCEFVIIKAAGSYVDGELYTDPKFKQNIENALKNNLQVGVYLYSNSNSIEQTKKEIDYLLELIKDYKVEYVSFDWENFTDFNTYNINLHTLNEMANIFLKTAQENKYKPLLYSSKYYLENIWESNYEIWVAQYADVNTYNGTYKIWQHCSDGRIQGIDAYVDIDIMYE